ncbi:MAG: amino acid ABC transporter permease [Caldisericia bacterium]|nr:amino acid ABC transporter permease [Caldisericia bacterium]MDD5689519.1 amino acid ABC transporter permease [Caldisericia bacterium]
MEFLGYEWRIDIAIRYLPTLLRGASITFELTIIATVISTVIGIILCLLSIIKSKILNVLSIAYIEIFRGLPVLVVLIWVFYALPMISSYKFSPYQASIIALSFSQAAFLAEVFRAGIQSLEKGQMESARALGMSYSLAMRRVILPQAFRNVIPEYVNNFVSMLKWSSLAMVIGTPELVHSGQNVIQHTFRPLEIYSAIAIIYFLICYPFAQCSRYIERKYTEKRE